jgi:DNA-binding GntR family transcriptional regulator
MPRPLTKVLAYEYIKQGILSQRYLPGQGLVEGVIARELAVSRTPIREALRELGREGLVEIIPNRGAFVRVATIEELLEIFDVKIRLEGLCAARAAERSSLVTAARLFGAAEAMAAAAQNKDPRAYRKSDEFFHASIYEGAQSRQICRIIEDLNAQWYRMREGVAAIESRMAAAVLEHRRIAEAIQAGDAQAAETAMRVHLENLRDEIRSLLEHFVAPMVGTR